MKTQNRICGISLLLFFIHAFALANGDRSGTRPKEVDTDKIFTGIVGSKKSGSESAPTAPKMPAPTESAPAPVKTQSVATTEKSISSIYKESSVDSASVGVLMLAEGMAGLSKNTNVRDNSALMNSGLEALRNAAELKSQQHLGSAAGISDNSLSTSGQIMNSGEAKEVLSDLSKDAGISESELIEKMLASRGYPSAFLDSFPKLVTAEVLGSANGISSSEKEEIFKKSKVGKFKDRIKSSKEIKEKIAALEAQRAQELAAAEINFEGAVSEDATGIRSEVKTKSKISDEERSLASSDDQPISLQGSSAEFFGELNKNDNELSIFEIVKRKYTTFRSSLESYSRKNTQK